MSFAPLFQQISTLKVAVLGDAMLDSYWWGSVDRISPEAPVPIVALKNKEQRIGGAGNVALNTTALGANTCMLTVLGNDSDGNLLSNLLAENGVETKYILSSNQRITTNKTRIMSRNQQMMRLDAEITADLTYEEETALIQQVEKCLTEQKIDVLIFEDYNKGVLTQQVITSVINLCKKFNVVTTVDPKKHNFFAFKEVDLFKPNLKEVTEGLKLIHPSVNLTDLQQIHQLLRQNLHHHISLITLSEHGVFYQQNEDAALIPCHIRNIADVSGAGDTVIAVASLVYAATKNISLAAKIANIAGGLVCEEVGTVAINPSKLQVETEMLLND